MNLYFILHVCRIHNSKLSEENILLLVQNMGNQLTRQLGLYNRVLSAGWGTAWSSDWATLMVPRINTINIK